MTTRREEITLVCPRCEAHSRMAVAGEVVVAEEELTADNEITIMLLQCGACKLPVLMSQVNEWSAPTAMWPSFERQLSDSIPEDLRRVHEEARICFKAKAYTAAAVMVRRTLEGVGSNLGIKSSSLIGSLKELESRGLIEGRLLEWAQELRVLGNKAAHFTGGIINAADARDALELAEALLDYVYVFSTKFEQFKQRRSGQQA